MVKSETSQSIYQVTRRDGRWCLVWATAAKQPHQQDQARLWVPLGAMMAAPTKRANRSADARVLTFQPEAIPTPAQCTCTRVGWTESQPVCTQKAARARLSVDSGAKSGAHDDDDWHPRPLAMHGCTHRLQRRPSPTLLSRTMRRTRRRSCCCVGGFGCNVWP